MMVPKTVKKDSNILSYKLAIELEYNTHEIRLF